jgi:Protein of unknown function (DUF2550)
LGVAVLLDLVAATCVLALLAATSLIVRRRALQRRGGTFDCSLRLRSAPGGQGWVLGVGRYAGDRLEWYRVFSLSPRPRRVMSRRDLRVRGQRTPEGREVVSVLPGAVVLEALERGRLVELAMSQSALTGLLSWLESAPPGEHLNVA